MPHRSRAMFTTFARTMTPDMAVAISAAEDLHALGDGPGAVARLAAEAQTIPEGAGGDDDRIAAGEAAFYIATGGPQVPAARVLLERLWVSAVGPRARGVLLFYRGRETHTADDVDFLNRALAEFIRARDPMGRAMALAALAWPADALVSADQRLRLGREGLALAQDIDDPWVVTACAGLLAGSLMFLGDRAAYDCFALAADRLASAADPHIAVIQSNNQVNWACAAFLFGEYDVARRVLEDSLPVQIYAVGRNRLRGLLRLVDHQVGRRIAPDGLDDEVPGSEFDLLVAAAVRLETEPRIDARMSEDFLAPLGSATLFRWYGAAIQARLRLARNEPVPLRGLQGIFDEAARKQIRVGWHDALLVLAEHDLAAARQALTTVEQLWPDLPRAQAIRQACQGSTSARGDASVVSQMLAAADVLTALPEPVTAGRVLRLAAQMEQDRPTANALRRRAADLFREAGAERSLATVLRERTLDRGKGYVPIPASMAGVTTAGLTAREHAVARLAAAGLSGKEIAEELWISESTVRHHLLGARAKLGGVPKRALTRYFATGEEAGSSPLG